MRRTRARTYGARAPTRGSRTPALRACASGRAGEGAAVARAALASAARTRDAPRGEHRRAILELEARGDRPAAGWAALGEDDAADVKQRAPAVHLAVVGDVVGAERDEGARRGSVRGVGKDFDQR